MECPNLYDEKECMLDYEVGGWKECVGCDKCEWFIKHSSEEGDERRRT